MRIVDGCFLVAAGFGFVGFVPTEADAAVPSYEMTEQCAIKSGFTDRALRHPEYKAGKVYATPKELAFMNRCVAAVASKTRVQKLQSSQIRAVRGHLPFPSQYPLMNGDSSLWPRMTMAQQRRAMLFLRTGSTIQSSLLGD